MRCPACNSVFTIYLRPTLLHCQTCGKTTKLAKPKPAAAPAKDAEMETGGKDDKET